MTLGQVNFEIGNRVLICNRAVRPEQTPNSLKTRQLLLCRFDPTRSGGLTLAWLLAWGGFSRTEVRVRCLAHSLIALARIGFHSSMTLSRICASRCS